MKRSVLFFVAAVLLFSSCQQSLTSYVNPFVGTDGHGHTFPGAILPFGMVQASPDTRLDGWDGCSAYHYSDDTVYGFSHTHLSGTGCSDYGDLLIMPFTIKDNGSLPDTLDYGYFKSAFSHSNEKASPGYYRTVLDRNRVMAELTVHKRTALHRYTFPNVGEKGIVVDLKHRDVVVNSSLKLSDISVNGATTSMLEGYRISSAWNPDQHLYFAIVADCDFKDITFFLDGKRTDNIEHIDGGDCKAIVTFPDNVKEVTLTVAISAVDGKGAVNNLMESLGVTFPQAREQANTIWEQALSQIEVEGGRREDRANFYTALYHCMTAPYLYSDADGRYRAMKDSLGVSAIDTIANGRSLYTVFSVWDTYRALHPLLNIIEPERSADFVNTMLDHFRHSGELTMWELASHETHCMIGYHAVSVILDALRTGVLDSMDVEQLHQLAEAMETTATLPILGRTEYGRDGFLSSEFENESVSKTLEYAYDDWCISEYYRLLGEIMSNKIPGICLNGYAWPSDNFSLRSQSWKNIMDADGFMHPRRNGAFITPFNPTEVNNHFTEANSWQYSSYVPHDVYGWIAQIGGADKAERFLDSLFRGSSKLSGRDQSDITGMIGQYAHGNEPSHHAAYLYAFLGRQWKTAELVRQICSTLYYNSPDGLCGNEDCGQMSAWYVMSAMGFYPVCPGSGQYIIGSPLFNKVVIHLHNGKDITINAERQAKNRPYVDALRLNGSPYDRSYITIEQLLDGCTLDFTMSDTPNKAWAATPDGCPVSVSSFMTIAKAPVFGDWQQSFDGERSVTISGDGIIYYTTDGSIPDESSQIYTGPISVTGDVVIRARACDTLNGHHWSSVVSHRLTRTLSDRTVTYLTQPAPQYSENGPTGLIDRLHGSENYRIGGWQGWQGDCSLVVDLLDAKPVSSVGVECLENMKSWIFLPTKIVVETSLDNSSWQPFGNVDIPELANARDRQEQSSIHNYRVSSLPVEARYVRIKAVNYGSLPSWHISAGEQAWLFIDEIEVN